MPLTDPEKQRIRYHLGYSNIEPAVAMMNGVARPQQTSFMIDLAMDRIQEATVPYARQYSQELDSIEREISDARPNLAVEKVDTIVLRSADRGKTHTDLLEREYVRWAQRLADLFGCPLYANSSRFIGLQAGINVPVRG